MELKPQPSCGIMLRARCWKSADDLTDAVAAELRTEAARATNQPHAIMLAGGSTPLAAYARLAAQPPAPGAHLHLIFSDDRHVPMESPQSNAGLIGPLVRAWGVPDERILRVHGELPLADATAAYQAALQAYLDQGGTVPLGLLGLGADGHTASLFTARHIADGQQDLTLSVARPDGLNGVSVTPRFLRGVGRILFVVSGAGKRAMVERLIREPASLPAGQAVAGHRSVEVWMDREAWPFV